MNCEQPPRISVVGTSGSGKTTLAGRIVQKLKIPHIELDALHWGPEWTPIPRDTFRERVRNAVEGDAWVVDGNYSKIRDIVWTRANLVVWLDYPLRVILSQLLQRTLHRCVTPEELWNGNRETVRRPSSVASPFSYGRSRHTGEDGESTRLRSTNPTMHI